jgi:hypothetical protein
LGLATLAELFNLDVLPGHCSIAADVDARRLEYPWRIRFQAIKHRRWRKDKYSQWSGWFEYNGEPIPLRWDIFWVDA